MTSTKHAFWRGLRAPRSFRNRLPSARPRGRVQGRGTGRGRGRRPFSLPERRPRCRDATPCSVVRTQVSRRRCLGPSRHSSADDAQIPILGSGGSDPFRIATRSMVLESDGGNRTRDIQNPALVLYQLSYMCNSRSVEPRREHTGGNLHGPRRAHGHTHDRCLTNEKGPRSDDSGALSFASAESSEGAVETRKPVHSGRTHRRTSSVHDRGRRRGSGCPVE